MCRDLIAEGGPPSARQSFTDVAPPKVVHAVHCRTFGFLLGKLARVRREPPGVLEMLGARHGLASCARHRSCRGLPKRRARAIIRAGRRR